VLGSVLPESNSQPITIKANDAFRNQLKDVYHQMQMFIFRNHAPKGDGVIEMIPQHSRLGNRRCRIAALA